MEKTVQGNDGTLPRKWKMKQMAFAYLLNPDRGIKEGKFSSPVFVVVLR